MQYLEDLIGVSTKSNRVILVTTSDVKNEILTYRNQNKIVDNLKIMTESEFITSFVFKSSKQNIQYLIENNPWSSQKLNIDVAKNLEQVLAIVDFLNINDNLLFSYLEKSKVSGYTITKPKLPNGYEVVSYLPNHKDLMEMVIPQKLSDNQVISNSVFEFDHLLEEIEYVVENITEKVTNGSSVDDIIVVAPANYHSLINQQAILYGLPIATDNKISILSHNSGIELWNKIENGEILDLGSYDPQIAEAVIAILNEYSAYGGYSKFLEQVKNDFDQTKITISKTGGIKLITKIDSLYTITKLKEGHFYLLGNYQDGLITYKQDVDLINDSLKGEGLKSSEIQNKIFDSNLHRLISNATNIVVSYSKKLVAADVEIANNLSHLPIKKMKYTTKSKYSQNSDLLRFARANYLKEVFNANTDTYESLKNQFHIEYKDNKFQGVERRYENLKLSYTSINDYYKCGYKFYLNHILRIRNGEFDSKKVIVGNVVHGVLEQLDLNKDMKAEQILVIINEYITQMELNPTPVEKLYFRKLATFLESVCHYMKIEEEQIGKQIQREQEFEMYINDQVSIVGKIDKIISSIENDNLFVDIYDYKTGTLSINFDNIEYGFDLQNLIYFLLIKNYYKHETGEEVLMGTYQQQIRSKVLYDDEEVLDMMKIKGFTKQKHEYLFKRSEKIIGEQEVEKLLAITSEKINEAVTNIIDNNFSINPKVIDGKNKSCDFCQYQSICNKTNNDIIYINKEK